MRRIVGLTVTYDDGSTDTHTGIGSVSLRDTTQKVESVKDERIVTKEHDVRLVFAQLLVEVKT